MKTAANGRWRIKEIEPCHRCGSEKGIACRNYLRKPKPKCFLRVICWWCAAQPDECRCTKDDLERRFSTNPTVAFIREASGQVVFFPVGATAASLRGH